MTDWNENNFLERVTPALRRRFAAEMEDSCPDAVTLCAAMETTASAALRKAVAEHLLQCSSCAEMHVRLLHFDREVLPERDAEWRATQKRLDRWLEDFLGSAAVLVARAERATSPRHLPWWKGTWSPFVSWHARWALGASAVLAVVLVGVLLAIYRPEPLGSSHQFQKRLHPPVQIAPIMAPPAQAANPAVPEKPAGPEKASTPAPVNNMAKASKPQAATTLEANSAVTPGARTPTTRPAAGSGITATHGPASPPTQAQPSNPLLASNPQAQALEQGARPQGTNPPPTQGPLSAGNVPGSAQPTPGTSSQVQAEVAANQQQAAQAEIKRAQPPPQGDLAAKAQPAPTSRPAFRNLPAATSRGNTVVASKSPAGGGGGGGTTNRVPPSLPASLEMKPGTGLWIHLDSITPKPDGKGFTFTGHLHLPLSQNGTTLLAAGTTVNGQGRRSQGKTALYVTEFVVRGTHYALKGAVNAMSGEGPGTGTTEEFEGGRVVQMFLSAASVYERAPDSSSVSPPKPTPRN